MLALSPRKHAPNNGNDRNMENIPKERPHYIHVANPFQNAQPPDSLRSKARYSREQLVEVFQSAVIAPPESVLLRQFDIFTDQLLKPLMLSQSSAEEQMACLLLSNGTWSPSGVPATSGPPGRGSSGGSLPMASSNEGNFRQQSQRGRGLAIAQRRFPPRPLESDRVDNWRQRPGPVHQTQTLQSPGANDMAGQAFSSTSTSQSTNSDVQQQPSAGGLWQSRRAESRLAPSWLISNSSQNIPPDISQSGVSSEKDGSSVQASSLQTYPDLASGSISPRVLPESHKDRSASSFDSALSSEASKLFVEDITPYWTGGRSQSAASPVKPPESVNIAAIVAPTQEHQRPKNEAPVPTLNAVDGESLWNTLSHESPPSSLQSQRVPAFDSNLNSVFSTSQKASPIVPNSLSPISSDPAVVLAKKATSPAVPSPEPETERQAWFYVDPSGILQGPFSGQQMEEWDNEGYFPDDLRLRPAVSDNSSSAFDPNSQLTDERGFITLSKLRSAGTSGRSPFLVCNISPRQLSKEHPVADTRPKTAEPVGSSVQLVQPEHVKSAVEVPITDPRRHSWGSSLSSVSSNADVVAPPELQPHHHHHHHQRAHQTVPTSKHEEKQAVPVRIVTLDQMSTVQQEKQFDYTEPVNQQLQQLQKPAVSRLGIALTSESSTRKEEIGWGDEADEQEEAEETAPKSKDGANNASSKQQAEKKRRRKKSSNKPSEKAEPLMDPLLNAEPAEVRRARLAAEQLRLAEDNLRKLEDKDAVLAVLEKQRILREKERELERKATVAKSNVNAAANRPPSAGPPALPPTAKWAVAQPPPAGWSTKTATGVRPAASLLEIQRQEEMAEASERVQEETRRNLAQTIAASTQAAAATSMSLAWPLGGPAPSNNNKPPGGAPWGSMDNSSSSRKAASSGFWDDGDDDDDSMRFRGPTPQQAKSIPKLSNILGSGSSSYAAPKGGKQQKDTKPNLAPEMSVLASWVVSELSRRYASATSLSPDIVPAFARLLGTIDEISGANELMQRASPYFYRPEDAKSFVSDFITARTRLQQNPSLAQASAAHSSSTRSNTSPAQKPQQQQQSRQQQPQQQQQQQQKQPQQQAAAAESVQAQSSAKSKAKKKPIPVSASALFRLVGPPPPAPQPDE